jgi:hypothetical protein
MQADLGTSFPGMNPHINQEVINSNNQLYGSLLNLAEAYKKAGGDTTIFVSALNDAKENASLTAEACKNLVNELGKLNTVNIDGIEFDFKSVDSEQMANIIKKVQSETNNIRKSLNITSSETVNTEKKLQKTGKETQKTWKETADGVGTSADRAIMAIDSVSGAFGGASTGWSGVVGDVIELIKNPMTAAIAGAGLALMSVVHIGKKMWDEWNLSIE